MPGLNDRAWELVQKTFTEQKKLSIQTGRMEGGSLLLDMGVQVKGGLDAGLSMAEIGMAGLGKSRMERGILCGHPWQWIITRTDYPLEGSFLSQAAHWPVQVGSCHAMGSGPACLLNPTLAVTSKFGFEEQSEHAVLILETSHLPDDEVCGKLAETCEIEKDRMAILVAPTASQAGRVQIAARSVETALHKLVHLGFDLQKVFRGFGKCPLAPEATDDLVAMGLTNDMMIFGSQVWLEIRGVADADLVDLANRIPAQASPGYGETFLEALQAAGGFYNIDPGLFAPAEITLTSLETGKVARAGSVNTGRIAEILGD